MPLRVENHIFPENITEALEWRIGKLYDNIVEEKGNDKVIEEIKPIFDDIFIHFNNKVIEYCADQFIKSELDFSGPGVGGLGRKTDEVPRLANYLNKQFRAMSEVDLMDQRIRLLYMILTGYLHMAHIGTINGIQVENIVHGPQLLDAWISTIYTPKDLMIKQIYSFFSNYPPELSQFNLPLSSSNLVLDSLLKMFYGDMSREVSYFQYIHKIRLSGIFGKDKLPHMLEYYFHGGRYLRFMEIIDPKFREETRLAAISSTAGVRS